MRSTITSTSPLLPFLHYLFYVSMPHAGMLGTAKYASILGPLPLLPACRPYTTSPRVPYTSLYATAVILPVPTAHTRRLLALPNSTADDCRWPVVVGGVLYVCVCL